MINCTITIYSLLHKSFENFIDFLEYDELDLETYSNIQRSGLDNFYKEQRFNIARIDSILENVHKKKEAETLYQKLKNKTDVELMSSKTFINRQEFHIACIIFDNKGKILIHNDHDRGREFGCIKKIFGGVGREWKTICEEGYREKYGISIEVAECPVPVATYYYDPSNALGLIIIAEYIGTEEEILKKTDWNFFEIEELEATTNKCVENFMENIRIAIQLRRKRNGEQ